MPLLKYKCTQCGERFEELVSASRVDSIVCPQCGSPAERAYEGKCSFGPLGTSGGCTGNCATCSGCGGKHVHSEHCGCAH